MPYCIQCRRQFVSEEAKQQHLDNSPVHFGDSRQFECTSCDRFFVNYQAWNNHMTFSSRHNYCFECEREFSTQIGLNQHLENAAVHRNDGQSTSWSPEWEVHHADTDWDHRDDIGGGYGDTDLDDSDEDASWFVSEIMRGMSIGSPAPELPLSPVLRHTLHGRDDSMFISEPTVYPTPDDNTAVGEDAEVDGGKREDHGLALCPVCFESKSNVSATVCGHVFCTICINEALRHKYECPICRKTAFPEDLRRLYLSA